MSDSGREFKNNIKKQIKSVEQGFAWPGGYPMFLYMTDGGCICPKCVTENRGQIYLESISGKLGVNEWRLVCPEINWEDTSLYCDNCNEQIEYAYGDPS